LIFGVPTFVIGSLMIMNVWAVIDSSLAVSAAAREGARTFVEADPATAHGEAQQRMDDVMASYGRDDRPITTNVASAGTYQRCAVVEITAQYDLALVSLPVFGDFGSLTTIESKHQERIDAYRSGDFDGSCDD